METELIFQSKTSTIKYHRGLKSTIIISNGLIDHHEFKMVMEKAYDIILQKNLTGWISDLTNMNVILPENQKWTNLYFLPKVLKTTNIKKVAIIVGNDIFNQASMDKIRDEVVKSNLPIRYFNNYEDIKKWFKEKETAF